MISLQFNLLQYREFRDKDKIVKHLCLNYKCLLGIFSWQIRIKASVEVVGKAVVENSNEMKTGELGGLIVEYEYL